MKITIPLNNLDYIVVEDYHNGGINFKMFSKSQLGVERVFNNGLTQQMGISEKNIDNFITTLTDIRKMMKEKKE